MTKSKLQNNPRIQSSSRSIDVNADQELILDVNNTQGRRLSNVLSVDMENVNSLKTLNSDDPDPTSSSELDGELGDPDYWENAFHGLSIEWQCRNDQCAAYRCDVWCEKGFTVFNISDSVECPRCRKNVTLTNCSFLNCEWMFEGRKTGKFSVDVMSKWNVTTQKLQWFNDYGGLNIADWSTLIITAKRLVSFEPESAEPILYNCVLCFGPTDVSIPRPGVTSGASCSHAVHPKCARGFVQAGYSKCPKCRLPLDMVKLELCSNSIGTSS